MVASTSLPPTLPGTEIDFKHYRLRATLGEGGFGQVFEAWDSKLCRDVAVKRLKQVPQGGSASLIKEARMAASVQHAAFVQIYAIEDDDDSQSIVMELVRGLTLKKILANGPLEIAAALDIVRQVAQAMAKAHSIGLVHGDLKPSNIMRDDAGLIRILDFGLATHADVAATTTMSVIDPQGTIAYMAPERLNGGVNTPRTDVYALGVILFELLTGARPFAALQGLPLAAKLVQSTSAQWDYPANMSLFLRGLVEAMTAREPTSRLEDMGAVLAALDAPSGTVPSRSHFTALEQELITASGQKAANLQVGTPSRTRISRKTALLAVPVVIVLLFGAWQWRQDGFTFPAVLTGYSASREMSAGLEALRLYDRPGMLDQAQLHFERILKADPGNAAAVAGVSMMYTRRHQSDAQDEVLLLKALAGAQQALKLNDQLALAHAALGIALERDGKSDAALVSLSRARNLEPNNIFALLGIARAHLRQRRYDEARQVANQGLIVHPRERSFADLIGQSYFEQGDYAAAEKSFRHSLTLQPDAVYAYASLSAALQRQNRYDEALQILQQGLQVRPNAWLYGNLGNALFARGDYLGAAAAFENAVSPVKGNPGNYLAWANLADTLLWIPGRAGDAKKAYEKARQLLAPRLDRAPNEVLLVSRMGLYQARGGDVAATKALMERAIALAPKSLDVHFRAGLAFELTGNRARAIEEIVKARTLGYPVKSIDAEPDLIALRRDPAYSQP
jgi:tetratricopeptide (TPR) repeat protein